MGLGVGRRGEEWKGVEWEDAHESSFPYDTSGADEMLGLLAFK